MFKRIKLITMAVVLMTALVFSQKVKYDDSWGSQGFSLAKSSFSGVSVTHSVNEFEMAKAEINGETFTTVQLPGVFLPNDEGAPDLPGSSRYIAIPQGAKARYVISDMKKEVYQNIDMAPAPKIPWDSDKTPMEYKKNGEIYSKDVFYPSSPVIMSEPTKIRGLDVVMLGITPFQYNPVTKELIVYRDIKVDVSFEGGSGHFGEDRLRNAEWDRILKNAVLNNLVLEDVVYKNISDSKADEFEYIIICPDNATFINYANQLKEFRTKQGIKTGVVTTTQIGGNTEAAIEAYVNNAYNNWDTPPSAVLMMADWGASGSAGTLYAPTYEPTAYPCVSDNFYADVITTDGKALPEITFARMTAQTEAHLQTMVSKIINNETNPPTSVNFYKNPITALGWQTERWFQICSETVGGYMKNELGKTPVRINEIYEGNPTVDPWSIATNTSQVTSYFGPSGRGYIPATPQELGAWTGGDATDVANAINGGAFMLMHRDHGFYLGWGEPDFVSADIDLLTNTTPTFIFSMNCQSGAFDYPSEVFAEKFHRYTYNGQNSGALGVLVASETSYSFVNDAYTWGTFDYMWPDYMNDYGAAPTNNDEFMPAFASVSGKYFLDYSSWPYNTVNKIDTNYLFHLHGDAYMVVYTEVPQNLTVNHQDIFDSDNIAYVSADLGAKIALVANGQIIGTGTGTGSMTGITIVPQPYDTQVILTVTKQNYFRYEQTIVVVVPNSGGDWAISSSNIPFGGVTVGGSSTQQFTITNSHATEYLIGDITTITAYSVELAAKDLKNTLHYVIPPSTSRVFDLIFAPTAEISYNGNITITSTDTNHVTSYVAVSGFGAYPNITLPALASSSAAPEASVLSSFNIGNTGTAGLNYSAMSKSYTGFQIPGTTYHSNDFQSGLIYTNSGAVSWATGTGGTWNGTTTCAALTAQGTGIMTSAAFSSSLGGGLYLDFDQTCTFVSGSSRKVEYYNGTAWVQVYYNNTLAVTDHQRIALPAAAANSQLRFTGVNTKAGPTTSSWKVDNITVSSDALPYSWLTISSPTAGTVASGGTNAINYTCSAAGLVVGIYNANVTIASDDPDEPSKVLPVQFTVSNTTLIPGTPSNVTTTVSGANLVIDWAVAADATSYDVYSSAEPYGTFTFVSNVATNQYTTTFTEAKKFWYIVAKNATK
ncbi:TPA: hypothetical protein DCR49_06295 [Candidatus Delongbacteria bacterium]|nr:MAG: hypothetical protein A2Y39_01930 [Candidatus Delongbacteria bacterium GWF2_40_14]HAQ61595.1 hypothetical protein [Candidatus Delongbacteria bacterium]